MSARIELDREGWFMVPVESSVADPPLRVVGYTEHHPRRDNGEDCRGFMLTDPTSKGFGGDRPTWRVESTDPLTLSPSISCRACGRHYFVREGKVVMAE